MRITNWLHREIRHGFQRISVDVEYADGSREEVWFEMPDDIPACDNGNPWLALMIPLAAASGEDIRVDLPVDPYLLQNAGDFAASVGALVSAPGETRPNPC